MPGLLRFGNGFRLPNASQLLDATALSPTPKANHKAQIIFRLPQTVKAACGTKRSCEAKIKNGASAASRQIRLLSLNHRLNSIVYLA